MSDVEVVHEPEQQRYAVSVDGRPAGFAAYIRAEGLVVMSHTEVDGSFEGQGVGSALARAALDDLREQGVRVLPTCPFIKAWIDHHPEYRDLLYNAPRTTATD